VYIDIQALQISLLGGRVFFKGVRYHGNNETIFIHSGYLTWQYWLRKVKEVDLVDKVAQNVGRSSSGSEKDGSHRRSSSLAGEEVGGSKTQKELPCRLSLSVQGVEWFVYNRSAAYDSIVASMTREPSSDSKSVPPKRPYTSDDQARLRKRGAFRDPVQENKIHTTFSQETDGQSNQAPLTEKSTFATEFSHAPTDLSFGQTQVPSGNSDHSDEGYPLVLQFLPIYVECKRAAVVLGNENTKSVLITKVDRASGEIDASSSGVLDQYKQLINFQFEHPVIQIKPNDDYKEDQTAAALRVKEGTTEAVISEAQHHNHSFWYRRRRKAWHKLQDLVPYFRSSVESFDSSENGDRGGSREQPVGNAQQWQGLSRYLDETEQDDRAKWSAIEYATVTTIVDCPNASMSFYWDVPGKVPNLKSYSSYGKSAANMADINGDAPPQWGIDIKLQGALIHYGPWADRQRADLQKVFFPSLCKDSEPAERLTAGQDRVPTVFKLYIELEKETILRVPIREESKNWKWKKQADTMGQGLGPESGRQGKGGRRTRRADKGNPGPEVRPFGWFDVKVGPNASITYVMDMVANTSGFSNQLNLDLPHTEITTSVNHGLLWRSAGEQISCDLSNPLQWNGPRTWNFDITSRSLELFILREHIFLITDLVDDWASGPPPEFLTFAPFRYLVNLRFEDFRMYLNVNDSNIINNPSDFDDNTFIIIFGSILNADLAIPLDRLRPIKNEIVFNVDAKDGGLNLHVPPWNTQATFLSSTEMAKLEELGIKGTYQYCSTTSTSNTDTLLLDVYGKSPSCYFYGFLIRYFLKVKDNYFGEDLHFKTLEEYQELLNFKQEDPDAEESNKPPHKKSNDLDVILSITSDDAAILLPSNLYSSKSHVRVDLSTLATDLRFTNYYMDLDVDFSTLAFSLGNEHDGATTPISAASSTQLFVDGVKIYGHRLFGLPPAEPTYVCNWDFAVGAVTGECTAEFIEKLASGIKSIGFSFDDDENALPSISEIVLHDVTFLRASIEPVKVWLHVEEAALLFSMGSVSVDFDDWAGSHYSKKLKALIPDLTLACVDAESASRHRSRNQHPVETHAFFQTTLDLTLIDRKLEFFKDRDLQQEHIREHDRRTFRAEFLLHNAERISNQRENSGKAALDPPAMCFPPIPVPLVQEGSPALDQRSLSIDHSLHPSMRSSRRKSSFLSATSSSGQSRRSVLRAPAKISKLTPHEAAPLERQASRSRSRLAMSGRRTPAQLRDLSVSTGRQSSFYSALGDHGERKGMPPSSVAFSSSYIAPYFPLETVEPDTKDVPVISSHSIQSFPDVDTEMDIDDIDPRSFDDNISYGSFIVSLPNGVRGYLNPEAMRTFAQLLKSVQAVDPEDILDVLQIESISDIINLNKSKITTGKVTDINLRVPIIHVRFINPDATSMETIYKGNDQYDLQLSGLNVNARSKSDAIVSSRDETHKQSSSAHVRLRSINLSAKERFENAENAQAAVDAGIEDLVFWFHSGDRISGHLDFRVLEISTVSNKIEYLEKLVHQTTVIAEYVTTLFMSLISTQNERLRIFIYNLAIVGQGASDPLFLTRPSYVLRSATDHLRGSDSWKVVSRLRHMYSSLDTSAQNELRMACLNTVDVCPGNAREQVLNMLDQWRSWDLTQLESSQVIEKVFGAVNSSLTDNSKTQPLDFSLHFNNIRFVLDPGPKQNEIILQSITSKIEHTPPLLQILDKPLSTTDDVLATTVHVYCVDIAINLNWELCELANDLMKLYTDHQNKPALSPPSSPVSSSLSERKHQPKLIHVVVATERGSVTLDTINIKAISNSRGLKGSVTSMTNELLETSASVILSAEAATTRTRTRSEELTLSQLRHPSIYLSYEEERTNDVDTNVWKIAGNCQELSYVAKQDMLAIVELADLIIGDEISQVHRMIKGFPKSASSQPIVKASKQSQNIFNVALFLDSYHISIPLLQSLTYTISGEVARASIAARPDMEIVFDFDIKEHAHDIQSRTNNSYRSISLLQMPPTNGRINTHTSETGNSVSLFISVEPIEIDAAAIHSLLTAVNRPEISSVLKDMQDDVQLIKGHLEEVFGSNQNRPAPTITGGEQKPLVYNVHMTMAGLTIFATAPGSEGSSDTARLSFDLGCIHIEATNRLNEQGPVLAFPEIHIKLMRMLFELSRITQSGVEPCGNFSFGAYLSATSKRSSSGEDVRSFHVKSDGLEINLFADTASTVVDVLAHLQDKIKDLDLARERRYLKKLRKPNPKISITGDHETSQSPDGSTVLFDSMYSLELLKIQVSWIVGGSPTKSDAREKEDLVLTFERIDLSTRKENSARLMIEDLQLQMVPTSQKKTLRSANSALLPEVVFNVAYVSNHDSRRLAFQAAGKSLDLRLTSQFIIPAADLKRSIESASDKVRAATTSWVTSPATGETQRKPFFGNKRISSLLVDADFAGAVVYLQGKKLRDTHDIVGLRGSRAPQQGRYGQFDQNDINSSTTLRAPGLAWKIEYTDNGTDEPSMNAEVRVDASSNTLYPTVVPLILEISSTVKEIVSDDEPHHEPSPPKPSSQKFMSTDEENILTADPSRVLGRTRLNLGLRICRQEFSLSCQPIARVAATARFDDIYITINTVKSMEYGHFFAVSAAFTRLQASVQHVYSRESTGSFEVESMVLSLLNSKHVSGTSGLSAILKISPMKVLVNAKQLQDFLLFREIWVPPEIRQSSTAPTPTPSAQQSQTYLVQRYQQVAATGAFPWNATVSISELDVQLDLGQAIGKSSFIISNFWVSTKKSSDWEQNLCLGFEKIGVDSSGRMSGMVALQDFRVRTSIQWPAREKALNQTPLVQGSMGFSQLKVKVAFDYQAFLVADITSFEFLMYNIRNGPGAAGDRLVATLDGDSVQVFCTSTSASQGIALYQAILKLVQEKRTNYEASLREIERFMKRKSVTNPTTLPQVDGGSDVEQEKPFKSPISLHTDVVVTLRALNIGAFPSTFFDHQVFKLEALNAQARFAVTMDMGKVHSHLGLTLGQLRIGLAGVKGDNIPKSLDEMSVEDVVRSATGSRGGTILKVPQVQANMQTWQSPDSMRIDYIFKSSFEGKVEVGWNYSRISYIRGMWANHSRALAQKLGKPLPISAVKITGVPQPDEEGGNVKEGEQQKITAEVNVPQSKYEYTALETPIIETPQLRDMGEATPPLEWIGLHRERLPNLTHQIVIVALLEVASEVEDAYAKILGSS
jgi:hypothetical protein